VSVLRNPLILSGIQRRQSPLESRSHVVSLIKGASVVGRGNMQQDEKVAGSSSPPPHFTLYTIMNDSL
jgi:hypothetical protein